ncbi:Hypothetical predicted protein, partial [Pelobates cultripes]
LCCLTLNTGQTKHRILHTYNRKYDITHFHGVAVLKRKKRDLSMRKVLSGSAVLIKCKIARKEAQKVNVINSPDLVRVLEAFDNQHPLQHCCLRLLVLQGNSRILINIKLD